MDDVCQPRLPVIVIDLHHIEFAQLAEKTAYTIGKLATDLLSHRVARILTDCV